RLVMRVQRLLVRSKTLECTNNNVPHKDHIVVKYLYKETISSGIALLKVQQPFDNFNKVRVLLPSPFQNFPLGTKVTLAGWAHIRYTRNSSRELRYVTLSLVGIDDCDESEALEDHLLCAKGSKWDDTCQAYLGGAVVSNRIQIGNSVNIISITNVSKIKID
ncbi:hypothetical protein ILUMI_15659, partial [Ignelater luminosus]